jgi:hypothetical protein
MKKRFGMPLMVLLLAVFSITAYDGSANASSSAGPKLVIVSPEHSFGKVKPGTPLIHTFKVRNEGRANLEIKDVIPVCGCTAVSFDKIVSPNKESGITLKIEHTDQYRGEVVKTAEVTTNDPDRPSLTLTLRANFAAE